MDKRVWPGAGMIIAAGVLVFFATQSASSLAITVFILSAHMAFFRDPKRRAPEGGAILSPADGTIDVIEEVRDTLFLNEEAYRVSIFLSIFDVHATRSPMEGEVRYLHYVPGKFLNALKKESGDKNESNWIGLEKDGRRILVKQTVGAIARRIYCDVTEGSPVSRGQKLGVICYGSRVDCVIPKRLAKLNVRLGDKVMAGKSAIAEWMG